MDGYNDILISNIFKAVKRLYMHETSNQNIQNIITKHF